MSKQLSFTDLEQTSKKKQTRREIFLAEMDKVMPWDKLEAAIDPFYPKAGNGRRPYPLSSMLRIYCLQQWYALSDPAMEESVRNRFHAAFRTDQYRYGAGRDHPAQLPPSAGKKPTD